MIDSTAHIKLAKTVSFSAKKLARLMTSVYTVPLFDMQVEERGKKVRKFYLKHKGSGLTAEYIVVLLRHLENIIKIPDDIGRQIRTANEVTTYGDLYAISSSILSGTLAENVAGSRGNTASGSAGNVSASYFTPQISKLANDGIINRNIPLKGEIKLLSKDQYDLLNEMEAYLILDKEQDNIGIPLKKLSKEDLNHTIAHYKRKGYTPVRIIFDNLPGELANLFNTKPINVFLKEEITKSIATYFEETRVTAVYYTNAKLREEFGVDLTPYLDQKISNHKFWCQLRQDGTLQEIYIVQTKELYYGRANKYAGVVEFDSKSFVKKSVTRVNNGVGVPALKNGSYNTVELKDLELSEVFTRINYKDYRYYNGSRGIGMELNLYEHMVVNGTEKIRGLLTRAKTSSTYMGDNDDDLSVTKHLELMRKEKDSIFRLIKTNAEESGVRDTRIQFKDFASIDVKLKFYDRGVNEKPKSYDNTAGVMNYCVLHKSNLAFEREKVMTVLFIDKAIAWLKKNGHSHIEIVLEGQVPKKTAKERGYIDCAIYSRKDGDQYGQSFEFKAWYDFAEKPQDELLEQCNDYDIRSEVEKKGVCLTYTGEPITEVKGVNLLRDRVEVIREQEHLPWLKDGTWGIKFVDIKKTKMKDINDLDLLTADAEDVELDELVLDTPIPIGEPANASELSEVDIPDLIDEAIAAKASISETQKSKSDREAEEAQALSTMLGLS